MLARGLIVHQLEAVRGDYFVNEELLPHGCTLAVPGGALLPGEAFGFCRGPFTLREMIRNLRRITNSQNGPSGKQFSLTVYDPSGVVYHMVLAGTPLQGGNVVVHLH